MTRVKTGRSSVALATFLALLISSTPSSLSASVSGTGCSKVGEQLLEDRKLFTCSKSGTKLLWKYSNDNTSTFAPFPITGLSWLEIAEQKEAADRAVAELLAKEAAELKAKRDAEIAAAELKARQEAEAKAAKAAKAEAEKPKIEGLTIGELLWSDDFKGSIGSEVDNIFWSTRECHRVPSMGGGACFNQEVQFYAKDMVSLDGSEQGAAVITTKRPTTSAPLGACLTGFCSFVSGRFDTHGKVSFQYGFIEARIKMPAGSGNHPAFWMLGDNINQVGWPTTGEMDITEIHSNDPTVTTAAINYSTYFAPNSCCSNHKYTVAALNLGVDVSAGYHTYAVAWLPNSISFYVDNKLISTTTPQTLGGYWSFNEKFFLILNNAVNASFSGSWENLQKATMSIDWVRSYQLNGQGQVFTK